MIELGAIETRLFELFTGVGISHVALTGGYAGAKKYYEEKFPGRSFDLDMERATADYRSQGHSGGHDNDFSMGIEDVADGDATEKQYRECKETLLENCPARDFMEIAKRQVKDFGKDIVRRVINEMADNICGK
jgi:hypothetical protein